MTFTDDNEVIINAMEESDALENNQLAGSWPKSETRILLWVACLAFLAMGVFIYLMKTFILH